MAETFDDSERARDAGLRRGESAESWPVRPGMAVMGSDGGRVGQVKEVRRTDFLVSRTLAADIYVPYSACQALDEDQVILNVPAGSVGDQGWASPERTGLW